MSNIKKVLLLFLALCVGATLANDSEDQDESNFSPFAESMAASAAAAAANSNQNLDLQCERIEFSSCRSMPYNVTRMPNFFNDPSQADAAGRSRHLEQLIRSQCSAHLLSYLCELLAPMCLSGEIMKRYKMILPCRSFCRQVKSDCIEQSLKYATTYSVQTIQAAFNCSELPFERNGGNSSLDGPCHEIPVLAAPTGNSNPSHSTSSMSNMQPPMLPSLNNKHVAGHAYNEAPADRDTFYRPYERDSDFPITDNTPIDASIIRPSVPAQGGAGSGTHANGTSLDKFQPKTPSAAGLMSQLQILGHQVALALVKYSNVLSILTLLCLLLVVNAKRLRRLGSYLGVERRKGSSSSSASSTGSQRKLASSADRGPSSSLAHAHKLAMSPSASSRSLVLFAGDGKRSQPSHRLVEANEHHGASIMSSLEPPPSQKLYKAGLDRRTLINTSDTLERDRHALKDANEVRYKLMQSTKGSGQALGNHQYDYIQVAANGAHLHQPYQPSFRGSQQQQQQLQAGAHPRLAYDQQEPEDPQVYSNILLSSPGHQVLLFGDDHQSSNCNHRTGGLQLQANRQAEELPRIPQMPPSSRSHFVTAANLSLPYAAPDVRASNSINRRQHFSNNSIQHQQQQHQQQQHQLDHEHQRSFQRRPSGGTPSWRYQRSPRDATGASLAPAATYVSSSGASSSSSSSSSGAASSSSAFSQNENAASSLLLGTGATAASCSLSSSTKANHQR